MLAVSVEFVIIVALVALVIGIVVGVTISLPEIH